MDDNQKHQIDATASIRNTIRNQLPTHLLTDFDEIIPPISYFDEFCLCSKHFLDRLDMVRRYGTVEIPTWEVIHRVLSVIGRVQLNCPSQLAYWGQFLGGNSGETVRFTDEKGELASLDRVIYMGEVVSDIPVLSWPGFDRYITLKGF